MPDEIHFYRATGEHGYLSNLFKRGIVFEGKYFDCSEKGFDLIGFENLHIQNMVQNHHLAKSIMDAGWYQLQTLTASKAEEAGKHVKLCIASGTSQTCHICGNKQKMTLRDRVFRCNQCGNVENRDTNAANEVLNRCTVGMTGIEACQSGLRIDTMKQEAPTLQGG